MVAERIPTLAGSRPHGAHVKGGRMSTQKDVYVDAAGGKAVRVHSDLYKKIVEGKSFRKLEERALELGASPVEVKSFTNERCWL